MKKGFILIELIVVISIIGILVFIIFGQNQIREVKYIAENEATIKCEKMGGVLKINYDWGVELDSSKLIFTCIKRSEVLFETK